MSIEQTDAESRAVAKNDNRISLAFIESEIETIFYPNTARLQGIWNHPVSIEYAKDKLAHLTVCFLVLRNGFVVIGKSAPLDPANFNAELGRKFAYEDAVRQLWPLFAFAKLAEK